MSSEHGADQALIEGSVPLDNQVEGVPIFWFLLS